MGNISREDKSSLALMPRTDTASRKYEWENSVSRFCQVKNRFVEAHIEEASNIFPKHPMGPQLGNDSAHFRPQVAGIREALSPSGCGKGLAGKAPGDNGNGFKSSSFKERLLRKRSNVPKPGHIRPSGFQDRIGKVRPFALADGFKPGGLRCQVQAANTGEQADVS